MCKLKLKKRSPNFWATAFILLLCSQITGKTGIEDSVRRSVVKIYVTIQRDNYTLPWQRHAPTTGTGSGFIIKKKRILTNAHLVSDCRFIEIQRDGDPRRYQAEVGFVGHDCDLAVVTVQDLRFFEDTQPLQFATELPRINDPVEVLGYPLGGTVLSVTRGVVSRIDYNVYAHSGVDQHLVLQVDAAINPGNSGGPVLYRGRVVGLAFQGLSAAENIGYSIPLPVIQHFLRDIEDGVYNGYPELGVGFFPIRNEALRRSLQLPDGKDGLALYYIDPFGSARGFLREGDVLTSIDGRPIAQDGTILLDGIPVLFAELLERKQWGETITLGVCRDGREFSIPIPLTNPPDPFTYRNLYNQRPEYVIVGGLVFSPLTRPLLERLELSENDRNVINLFYHAQYAKIDGLHTNCDEFVVLIRRLPHPVNTYADSFLNGIVTAFNGRPIRSLRDVAEAVHHPFGGFHVIQFAGIEEKLVLDAEAAKGNEFDILGAYAIPSAQQFNTAK
ncbi:MAG: trypsin-like peptidase domain-containing protein [Kiritimatiellia bacterium]